MPTTKFKEPGGKEFIGRLEYSLIESTKERVLRIDLIFLEEQHRGKGHGSAIIQDTIKKAKNMGCTSIIANLTKPDYDYWSAYEQRASFFNKHGFIFDEEGGHTRLDL